MFAQGTGGLGSVDDGPQNVTVRGNYMKYINLIIFTFILMMATAGVTFGQTTSFTYQGKLETNGAPANGTFLFQFKVLDANNDQVGPTITDLSTNVSKGIFTVQLDFGDTPFDGNLRFLQIAVRDTVTVPYVLLSPAQQLTSAPYAIRSSQAAHADDATTATTAQNSLQLGGIAANQYVLTGDSRLSDARQPTAGSSNYIQNSFSTQPASNFNISGNGAAGGTLSGNIVSAAAQFNIGASRVLSIAGAGNAFLGADVGVANTSGNHNSFFGTGAGQANVSGAQNAFFGYAAGAANTVGNNSFFGSHAGFTNTTGTNNAFFGYNAGFQNGPGSSNAIFGSSAGSNNLFGSNNTLIGYQADIGNTSMTNATAIGSNAFAGKDNSLVLGSINGVNGATADVNVGIGTISPAERLHIADNGGNVLIGNGTCGAGFAAIGFAATLTCSNYAVKGNGNDTIINRKTGATISFRENDVAQVTIEAGGALVLNTLGTVGSTSLCLNPSKQIASCSSSLRYKTNIDKFSAGVSFVNKLRPISFDWKQGGMRDIGFGAEDVAKIDPRFVIYNAKGEVEGVKYDRITTVLVNSVKEQQAQIDEQNKRIALLESQLKRLTRTNRTKARRK